MMMLKQVIGLLCSDKADLLYPRPSWGLNFICAFYCLVTRIAYNGTTWETFPPPDVPYAEEALDILLTLITGLEVLLKMQVLVKYVELVLKNVTRLSHFMTLKGYVDDVQIGDNITEKFVPISTEVLGFLLLALPLILLMITTPLPVVGECI